MNLHVVNLFSFPSFPFTTLSGRNMYKIINPTARLAWENSGHLVMLSTTGFPIKWSRTNTRRNSMMMCHYPDLGSSSDWLNQISHAARPMRSTTQIWVVTRYSMEFLSSFLRRHLVGKPVVALPNVGCFLRLQPDYISVFCFLKSEKWPFNHSSDMSHFIISVFLDTLIILHLLKLSRVSSVSLWIVKWFFSVPLLTLLSIANVHSWCNRVNVLKILAKICDKHQ